MSASRFLRSIFWNQSLGRARTPWLIAIPIVGAYVALSLIEILLGDALPQPVVALAVSGGGALTAVLLVVASHRFLGARAVRDYGLSVDRRWMADLAAGLVVGAFAYTVPVVVALATGAFSIEATFDRGDLSLWLGIAIMVLGCLCTGFWEELLLRGVFITDAVDGLRSRFSRRASVVLAIIISSTVFGLPHLAQPDYPALILTWIFSGVMFGLIYVTSGNLAFVIGSHAAWNIAYNALFVRTELPSAANQSAIARVSHDTGVTALSAGGVIDASGYALLGVLGLLWVLATRGVLRFSIPHAPRRTLTQAAPRHDRVPVPEGPAVTHPRRDAP